MIVNVGAVITVHMTDLDASTDFVPHTRRVQVTSDGAPDEGACVWALTCDDLPVRWVLVKCRPGTGPRSGSRQEYVGAYR